MAELEWNMDLDDPAEWDQALMNVLKREKCGTKSSESDSSESDEPNPNEN